MEKNDKYHVSLWVLRAPISSWRPFGPLDHADVYMMHVSMMHLFMVHVSMIMIVASMMYAFMMQVSLVDVFMMHVSRMHFCMMHVSRMQFLHDACIYDACLYDPWSWCTCVWCTYVWLYDACIYDPRSLTLMHVWMMHECMLHISMILVPDVCMIHKCVMHVSMILVPDPDACMNVWCMNLWSMMGLKFCHERTNKTISGVGWLVLLLSSAHISFTLLGPCLCVLYSESDIQRALCREILMTSINHIWVKIIYGGKSNRRLQYTAFRVLVLVKHKARQRKEASLRF